MAEVLANPNNTAVQGNNFWSNTVSNLTKLFDSGTQIYSAIQDKAIAKKQAVAIAQSPATKPDDTVLGLDKSTAIKYALIGAGALVLILVLKKR